MDGPSVRPSQDHRAGAESVYDRLDRADVDLYGLARNHPFTDGNKRTAWVLARLFLALNSAEIAYAPEDAVRMVL